MARPACGYHRSKDGAIDVTPIGDELNIVAVNQTQSPLLSTHAEIRDMIYKLVLGSTDFKQQPRNGFDGRSDLKADGEHPNPAPLRVSRQIYKETQNMLYETSTFTGNDLRHFMPLLKQLKLCQRKLVKTVRLTLLNGCIESSYNAPTQQLSFKKWLPNLNTIELDDVRYSFEYGCEERLQKLVAEVEVLNPAVKVTHSHRPHERY